MTNIASFNGGMWNDEFLLAEGQYVYSENLDIYRDPRWIQLAVKPTNYKTALPSMVYIIGATSTMSVDRSVYFALESKDIIDATWTLRFDGSTIRPNALWQLYSHWRWFATINSSNITFWDYYGGIVVPSSVSTPAASPAWSRDSGTDYDMAPYAFSFLEDAIGATYCSTGWTRPFYTIGSNLFFWDTANQYNITQSSGTWWMAGHGSWPFWPWYATITSYAQWIDQPWEIVFSSVHSDSVWSWSTNRGLLSTELSALSVVNGVANGGTKQLQIDKYFKVLHGVNKNNTDILVAGDVSEYIYDTDTTSPSDAIYAGVSVYKHYGFGSDAQQMIARSRKYDNIVTAFDNHGLTYYLVGIFWFTDYNWAKINDMVYCISNKDNIGQIYAYGKNVAGLPDAWSVAVTKNSSGKKMKRIGCLFRNYEKNWFYYSYEDEDWVFGIDYYDDITIDTPTSYQPSGKIFLRTDDGGDMSLEKEVKILTAWVYVPENTTIKISYILDNSGTEIDYVTITNTTQGTNAYKKYRGNIPVKGFKCISWFVELTTTGTETPKLYNFNYELWIVQA